MYQFRVEQPKLSKDRNRKGKDWSLGSVYLFMTFLARLAPLRDHVTLLGYQMINASHINLSVKDLFFFNTVYQIHNL